MQFRSPSITPEIEVRTGRDAPRVLIVPIYHLYLGQLRENGFATDFADSSDRYDETANTLTPRADEEVLADIENQLTSQTCLVFINSPRNPDGKIYRRFFLEGVLALLDQHASLRIRQ